MEAWCAGGKEGWHSVTEGWVFVSSKPQLTTRPLLEPRGLGGRILNGYASAAGPSFQHQISDDSVAWKAGCSDDSWLGDWVISIMSIIVITQASS